MAYGSVPYRYKIPVITDFNLHLLACVPLDILRPVQASGLEISPCVV